MTKKQTLAGVWKTLAEQHARLSTLLDRVRPNSADRAAHWAVARTELLSHERGELREVYPVLRQYPELRALADEHDIEAKLMEQQLLALDDAPVNTDAWTAGFELLAEMVLRHAAEEEQSFFPKAQQIVGNDVSIGLEATFLLANRQLAAQV